MGKGLEYKTSTGPYKGNMKGPGSYSLNKGANMPYQGGLLIMAYMPMGNSPGNTYLPVNLDFGKYVEAMINATIRKYQELTQESYFKDKGISNFSQNLNPKGIELSCMRCGSQIRPFGNCESCGWGPY